MTAVKICGLRTVEHALVAADAGADLLGLVFAPSRRQVAPDQAAAIAAQVRAWQAEHAGRSIQIVGVFVNELPERMLELARVCDLDALQLSGDEPVGLAQQLDGSQL